MSAVYESSYGKDCGLVVLRELVLPGLPFAGAAASIGHEKADIESASPLRVVSLHIGDILEE